MQHWNRVWALLIVLSVGLLAAQPLVSITADLLYLAADRLADTVNDLPVRWLFHSVQRLAPKATFVYNRAGVRYADRDNDAAAAAFTAALQTDPTSGLALNNLAVIAYRQGDLATALELQKRAIVIDPNRALLWYNLGVVQAQQGEQRDAEQSLREANRIAPTWALPYMQLGKIHLDKQAYAAAIEMANSALALDAQHAPAHLIVLDALIGQCDWQAASKAIQTVERTSSSDDAIRLRKAHILHALGQDEAALAQLETLFLRTTDAQLRWQAGVDIGILQHSAQLHAPDRRLTSLTQGLPCQ